MRYDVAGWVLEATAAATVLLMLLIALVRVVTMVRDRRQARAHATVLPLLLDVTDGEDVPVPRKRSDARAMGTAAAALVHKVRGADRDALATWLRTHDYEPQARRGLRARRPSRRAVAIELYLALGADPAPVVAMLRDKDPRVRSAAARALGEAGVVEAVPAIALAVGARRRPVSRSVAAMAIVQVGPASADAFGVAWASHEPRVQRLVIDTAGHLALADARDRLEEALSSSGSELRAHAATALGRIGSPRSVPALRTALALAEPETAEARAVGRALGLLGEGADL